MRQRETAERRAVESRVVQRRWRERLAAWKQSGQDERVFCEREKVGLCTFRWWVRRLGSELAGECVKPVPRPHARNHPTARAAGSGAQRWAEISAEWERSGVGQIEFCRERGLAVHTFRWWRWRLGRGRATRRVSASKSLTLPASTPATPPAFLPVQVIAEPRRSRRSGLPSMDIVLRRRRRVRVGADFDARLLARVVSVLEAIP